VERMSPRTKEEDLSKSKSPQTDTDLQIFRILGDCSHILSKCILIFAIHRNRSAEGVPGPSRAFST
jgi:hypothetical protein